MSNLELVERFIDDWNSRNLEGILSKVSEDIFYHNIPMTPLRGRNQLREAFGPMIAACAQIDWRIHHIAQGADGTVLTERTDSFLRDGKTLSVRVMGTFEIQAGLICAWRDYFDLAEWQAQSN